MTRTRPYKLVLAATLTSLLSAAWSDADLGEAELCIEECLEASVCYRAIEWREANGESKDAGAATVATMEVRKPLALEGVDIEPGHYAWLLRELEAGERELELRSLKLPEGLRRVDPLEAGGRVGDALYRAPLRFDLSEGIVPRLTFKLIPGSDGIRLSVQYGDGRFDSLLLRRGEP